jgi:glycosyltransferase involved in cell wall biosynthesis
MTAEPTVKVALCVPAYNAARTLPRLLESARGQTAPVDEIWVYDDASRDDTAAVARAFGAQVVGGTTNVGCSAGKNALLAQVSSDWVHFHDADDFVHPEFVARVKARAAQDAFDVLLMDYEQVDEATGTQMSRSRFAESDLLADPLGYLLRHTVNNGGAYRVDLLRRVGGFDVDPAIRFNEDRMFHLRLVEAGARVAHEPYLGCRFYYSPDSMSAGTRATWPGAVGRTRGCSRVTGLGRRPTRASSSRCGPTVDFLPTQASSSPPCARSTASSPCACARR